eukprot:3318258-Alexandrium_andersonii.AAC.1
MGPADLPWRPRCPPAMAARSRPRPLGGAGPLPRSPGGSLPASNLAAALPGAAGAHCAATGRLT